MRCHLSNKSFVTGSAPFFKQALLLAIASCFAAPPLLAQEAATGEEVLPDVRIIATTPVGSTGIHHEICRQCSNDQPKRHAA